MPLIEQFNIRYHTKHNRCHCHINSKHTSQSHVSSPLLLSCSFLLYNVIHLFASSTFYALKRTTPLFHENLIHTTRINDNYIETENHIVNIRITYIYSYTPHYISLCHSICERAPIRAKLS